MQCHVIKCHVINENIERGCSLWTSLSKILLAALETLWERLFALACSAKNNNIGVAILIAILTCIYTCLPLCVH